MKIAAGITLFNPKNEYINNIIKYTDYFDLVLVFDNSENNNYYFNLLNNNKKIIYLTENTNKGLPYAYNLMLDNALKENCDFMCSLDQDSILDKDNFNKVKDYLTSNNLEETAIVSVPTKINNGDNIKEKQWVICSGSFINVKLINKNKIKYDEAYFIDRFDQDLCKQIRNKKLKIIELNNVFIAHTFGENGNYSVLRHYYIFRNRFYYYYKFYNLCYAFIITRLKTLSNIIKILINEDDKIKKIKILKVAYSDFKNNHFGQ